MIGQLKHSWKQDQEGQRIGHTDKEAWETSLRNFEEKSARRCEVTNQAGFTLYDKLWGPTNHRWNTVSEKSQVQVYQQA